MITTLLFDLDDTLLGNEMGSFLPAYFGALTQSFPETPPQQFTEALLKGTRAMIANTNPARNLITVFAEKFYPLVNAKEEEWEPRFAAFYRERFPQLKSVTRPLPAARPLLDWASAAGYEIVIATSPLFPRAAIAERLRWAGLEGVPLARFTSYETSHFSKPHPEYLAEILAHLGRRPEEALMIGNDWEQDIAPAATLGMASYWIAPPGSEPPTTALHPFGIGTLEMFAEWARSTLSNLTLPPPPASALPFLLTGNVAAAYGLSETVAEADWKKRSAPDEWSLTEIICHLRDVEREVNRPRLRAVLESDNPFISGVDSDPWAEARDYQSQSGPEALKAFATARAELCALLAAQSPEEWNRPARHALFGPTHLAEIVGWVLDHDRIHLSQLREAQHRLSA